MKYLPSKKVLSLLILSAALVSSIIIAFGREKSGNAIYYASNLVAGEKISVPENPNWQNDLNEVGLPEKAPTNNSESKAAPPESSTDTISRSLLSNYLALKQGGTLDQTSAQKLVDQTVNYIEQTGNQVTRISQLNIVPDNGEKSITEYGENLGNIFKNNKPTVVKNELEIITSAVQSKDISQINELDGIIMIYEKLTKELSEMPVPNAFAKAHLDMVNGVRGMALALKEMKSVLGDPIKGLSSMQLYSQSISIFSASVKATHNYIVESKIIYKQGSGGYYLLYGI